MNRTRSVFSIIAVVIFIVGIFAFSAVQAQTGQGGASGPKMMCEERFKSMDTNGDGKITEQEFMSGPHKGVGGKPLEESFKATDTNGDKTLSKEEFCAGKGGIHGMQRNGGKTQ